ncbi:unnamed protein product [Ilex paraguariensis]
MSGRNAKTNFPVAPNQTTNGNTSTPSPFRAILSAKLRKYCCKSPSPSLTCLRLDTENSHIGVWQKRAGARSDSNWVMTVELDQKKYEQRPEKTPVIATSEKEIPREVVDGMNEEERIALQMIEELLNWN